MKEQIQKFGRSLSAMVMPNIGAFIAWGLITAIFIPGGWWPDENIAKMVSPMLKYLLPTLIAFTAGKNVGGYRGGCIGRPCGNVVRRSGRMGFAERISFSVVLKRAAKAGNVSPSIAV